MPGRATALREEAFKHLNAASRAGISPLLINAAAGFYTSRVNPWLSGGRGAHPEHQPQASAVPGPTSAPRQHRAGTHGCPAPALCRLGWRMHPVGALKAKPGHLCEQLPSPPRAKAADPLSGRFSADVIAAGTRAPPAPHREPGDAGATQGFATRSRHPPSCAPVLCGTGLGT